MAKIRFGEVTKPCSSSDQDAESNGLLPSQLKSDALYQFDMNRLVPSCVLRKNEKDFIVYKKQPDYILFVGLGLFGLLILILIIMAFKRGVSAPTAPTAPITMVL